MGIYHLHNIYVDSDIDLYGQALSDVSNIVPDVTVKKVPMIAEPYSKKISDGIISEHSKTISWFSCYAGFFLIENGKNISICPNETEATASSKLSYPDIELAGFITGWAMSFLMLQRGFSAIHSSALSFGKNAFLVAGLSGAGKSTISLNLLEQGCRYLTDDISYISPDNNLMVYPGLPVQKLCRDAAEKVTDRTLLSYSDTRKDKFSYVNKNSFMNEPAPLKTLYLLECGNTEELSVKEMFGAEKLGAVIDSLYMKNLFDYTNFPIEEKVRCLKLASMIRVFRITRPRNKDTVNDICGTIKKYEGESYGSDSRSYN